MLSCYGGHIEIVVQLINAGAMVNRMSKVMLRNVNSIGMKFGVN